MRLFGEPGDQQLVARRVGIEVLDRQRLPDAHDPLGWQWKQTQGTEQREGRRYRQEGKPDSPRRHVPLEEDRVRLLGADDPDGHQRHSGLERQPHHPTTPEALQLITLAHHLGGALRSLGKRDHELLRGQQALGILTARAYTAQAREVRLHEGQRDQPVGDEETRLGLIGMLAVKAVGEDQSIPGDHARAVRHQQGRCGIGEVGRAVEIHPPVVIVEQIERAPGAAHDDLVHSELVDLAGALAHPDRRETAPHAIEERLPVDVGEQGRLGLGCREALDDLSSERAERLVELGHLGRINGEIDGGIDGGIGHFTQR
jgi:hypothetical protein